MSEQNNTPPTPNALERTLNEILASESVLDGRNGQHLLATVEEVVGGLLHDTQLKSKLTSETKVGFGMALGKFLAWKVWTDVEKSDRKKAASKAKPVGLTLCLPEAHLSEVKNRWSQVRVAFHEKVGFHLAEPTLEISQSDWSLEIRGGLLEKRQLAEDWFEPLVQFLVDHSPQFLTLSLVKRLIDEVKANEPVVAEEMERLRLPVTTIYKILESLLSEGVPIHEMETILTSVILSWEHGPDRPQLISAVRKALSPWICKAVQVAPGVLRALKVGRRIEEMFADSVRYVGSEQVFALEPQKRAMVCLLIKQAFAQLGGTKNLILLTNHRVRQELRTILKTELPGVVVMSDSEIHRGFKVEVLAIVDFKEAQPALKNNLAGATEDEVALF